MGNIISKNLPTKYETGYVYKIYKGEDCYIGSCKDLNQRLIEHRYNSKTEGRPCYGSKFYTFLRENGGFDTFEWKILDIYQNIRPYDLLRIEGKYQKQLKPNLNAEVAGRIYSEYYKDTREKQLLKSKRWRENNKEHRDRYSKEKIPCPTCGKLIGRPSMAKHKKRFNH